MNRKHINNLGNQLALENYRQLVKLDEPFRVAKLKDDAGVATALLAAVVFLLEEQGQENVSAAASLSGAEQRRVLQHLLTIRAATPLLPDTVQRYIDQVRQFDLAQKEVVDAGSLPTVAEMFGRTNYPAAAQTVLWQGDISTLAVDGIVNAANAQLLGCFVPFHKCIDNVIHTAAGPRLREDCHLVMQVQGHSEQTGLAKVTRAYNLPSKFVLHTVGPIVDHGRTLTTHDRAMLAQAYRAVLDLSAEINLSSIAFCCISTGVFGFPKKPAAQIALDTVAEWLAANPDSSIERVIFNVFTDADLSIYQAKLSTSTKEM